VAALDAAVMAGVKHVVFMSIAGARQVEEPALAAAYWRGEWQLIPKVPTWTILRMSCTRSRSASKRRPRWLKV